MIPQLSLRCRCECCECEVIIDVGDQLELHDLLQGTPYSADELPIEDEERVVLCMDCVHDAGAVRNAGLPFSVEALRAALDAAQKERLRISDGLEDLAKVLVSGRLQQLPPSLIEENDHARARDDELLVEWERAQLLKHYHLALDTAAEHHRELQGRREAIGLPPIGTARRN